jgi:hypothetical protein
MCFAKKRYIAKKEYSGVVVKINPFFEVDEFLFSLSISPRFEKG